MGKLQSSSTEVGKVVQLINSIAEQTNLLALNATIEAAAGDALRSSGTLDQTAANLRDLVSMFKL
jgi:methyl-accepting chemotaxis protein